MFLTFCDLQFYVVWISSIDALWALVYNKIFFPYVNYFVCF